MHPLPRRPRMAMAAAIVVAATAGLLLPAVALAHAELVTATPPDGSTVVGTPPEIAATFTEPLLPASTLSIRDAAGTRLAVGGPDPADDTRLTIDPAPELAPGAYEVRWSAFTADGHLERGTWTFIVEAPPPTDPPASAAPSSTPAPSASPAPSGSVAPSPSAGPSATAAPSDPAATDGMAVLLPILAALAIVAVGAMLLLGRRGRPGPPA